MSLYHDDEDYYGSESPHILARDRVQEPLLNFLSVIEEVPISEIVFEPKVGGVHDRYEGQVTGHYYILRSGQLFRVLPVFLRGKKIFFSDINHQFDAEFVNQVWRIRPKSP